MTKCSSSEEPFPKSGKTDWESSNWYKEWLELAKKDYHGKRCGYWYCYFDRYEKLQYDYVEFLDN